MGAIVDTFKGSVVNEVHAKFAEAGNQDARCIGEP
jgi:hypothetical protein